MKYKVKGVPDRYTSSGCGTKASEFVEVGKDGAFETSNINRAFQYVMSLNDYRFRDDIGYNDGPFRAVEVED